MKYSIVGYSGLVGSNIITKINKDKYELLLYNSKNYGDIINDKHDVIIFAGLPAIKWQINKNDIEDRKLIEKYKEILLNCSFNKLILISTIDIYNIYNINNINIENCTEDNNDIDYLSDENYGRNRYDFELFLLKHFFDKIKI